MSNSFLFIKLIFKSYKATKFSVGMLIASLVIASCGLSTVLIINSSAKQSYSSSNTFLISNVQFQVVAKNPQRPISKQDYANLRKQGFAQLIAVAQASSHIYTQDIRLSERRLSITGIDTVSLLPLLSRGAGPINDEQPPSAQNSQMSAFASMPFSTPMGIVHPKLLQELMSKNPLDKPRRLSVEPIPFTPDLSRSLDEQQGSQKRTYLPELVAFNDPSLGNDLITDIGEFYRLFPNESLSSLLLVGSTSKDSLEDTVKKLNNALPNHLELLSLNTNNQQADLADSFHMNLLAMALLMFVVCLFIVINAVNLLINARMSWFKICRQLGISRHQIFISQLFEIIFFTFISSSLGIYLSIHLSNIIAPSVQATLEGLYGVQVGFGNTSLLSLFVQVFGISLCGSIAATIAPFKMTKESLNSNKSAGDLILGQKKWRYLFWLASIGFAIFAFIILLFATALWLLLLGTACLILSGCSLLLANYPQLINLLYKVIPSSFTMLRISTKQSIALSGKTKVACCAFFIAATSNIGMNLMVDSFRGATVSWLESRLASDYYLYYDGKEDIRLLASNAKVELFQRFENELTFKGQKLQQYSYPTSQQFKDAMVFFKIDDINNAWQAFEKQQSIFVNQQFSFAYKVGLGETILLPEPTTKELNEYTIDGIYFDFGNPYKQVLLPLQAFDPSISTSSIYSINTDEAGLQRFKNELAKLNINFENSLLSTQELLSISKRTFDRTFVITDGLNIVTLLVAALSLACAIVVLIDDLRPQNMLLRSLGVSVIKMQLLALFQYMLLCLIALICATPFGILLSWVLIYEINLQAFQWTYPLQINIAKIMYIYVVSLVVVFLVICVPVIRSVKRPLIEDIRWLN